MSRVVRKPAYCILENKDADPLRGNSEADQRLCFCYTDSTIPLYSDVVFTRTPYFQGNLETSDILLTAPSVGCLLIQILKTNPTLFCQTKKTNNVPILISNE